jgi:formylglycine-generating enzyme required for sulfatase activity
VLHLGVRSARLATLIVLATAPAALARTPTLGLPIEREAATSGAIALNTPTPSAVLIRAGRFVMGSDEPELSSALALCQSEPHGDLCSEAMFNVEFAPHEVFLSDYWLDTTEVTVERFRRCVDAGACRLPPYAAGGERFDRPSYPVTLVTWQDAAGYCAWVGGRLPTEAEWERGARGPSSRRYPWGDTYNPFVLNHGQLARDELDATDGYAELAPVGSFPDGRTPDKIADLAGNAEEWVADYFTPEYPKESVVNPKGPDSGEERVVRGGSYGHGRSRVRGAAREKDLPGARRPWRGFRCAYDPDALR